MANIKQLSSGSDTEREKALDSIFASMPKEISVNVDLPSKGLVYKNYAGVVVEPMTFEDEHRILSSRDSGSSPINSILEKCVHGVNIAQLLPFDKVYLLIKVREVSYGSDYQFDIVCPSCKGSVNTTVDISKFPINLVPDDFSDKLEITLPLSKAKVSLRLPRSYDELTVDPDNVIKNLARFVTSINGIDDPVVIIEALKKFHIRDTKSIEKALDLSKYGLSTKFLFECPHCKHSNTMEIPLTPNFFSVS